MAFPALNHCLPDAPRVYALSLLSDEGRLKAALKAFIVFGYGVGSANEPP